MYDALICLTDISCYYNDASFHKAQIQEDCLTFCVRENVCNVNPKSLIQMPMHHF